MKRREFIALAGGAMAAAPLAAHAQQAAMPVIGFLSPGSPGGNPDQTHGFRRGLKDSGFTEGENVAVEYRWAENQLDRLPALAADLVRRRVALIAAASPPAAFAAKAASSRIPIVFAMAQDPVKLGLVASLARPGGNLTGVNFLATELAAKRLELLRELVPGATRVAAIVTPSNEAVTISDVEAAARTIGLQIQFFSVKSGRDIDLAFAHLAQTRPDALFVSSGTFLTERRSQLTQWTARQGTPAIYSNRTFPEIGGLMSYGTNVADAYRQAGAYAGRILKGAKPADLPVVQSTKFELVVNAQTARVLGITVPPSLLTAADEVIE